jgi:hypothetical protein
MLIVRLLTVWLGLIALSMSCFGDDPCGSATQTTPPTEKRESDSTCDHVCPTSYYGQWNGVNYYSGPYCYGCTDGGFYFATSNDLHDLGATCTKGDCLQPIELFRGPFEFGAGIDQIELSEIEDYVGPQRASGPPGSGDDIRSSYFRPSSHITVVDEWIVLLRTRRGNRFFRVLQLEHDDLAPAPRNDNPTNGVRYVGQELNKDEVWAPDKTTQLRGVSTRDPRRAELQMEIDGGSTVIVEVIAKTGLRMKDRPD